MRHSLGVNNVEIHIVAEKLASHNIAKARTQHCTAVQNACNTVSSIIVSPGGRMFQPLTSV